MNNVLLAIFLIVFLFSENVSGQLSRGGYPMDMGSYKSVRVVPYHFVLPTVVLPTSDKKKVKPANYKGLEFAHAHQVQLTPDNSGEKFQLNGHTVWRISIHSPGAYALNVIFSKYHLPEGARLFLFDPDKNVVLGAFTNENNKPYKKLAVYPVPGETLVLQYEEPLNASFSGELEIGQINHDYKGVFGVKNRFARRFSEYCNVDVGCEFSAGLVDERRAVCRVIAGNELGTGVLLNNVEQNGKPYLLSAFHVYDDDETAQTALYDFNYESPLCTGINGYDNQSLSGSVARASHDSLDLMLVELSEMPPPSYRPYFAGWDATNTRPSNTYIIHHPNGDTKKISHDSGTCDSVRYNSSSTPYGSWKVFNWETGSTEGGSSGGPLFNPEKRVVGILSGGNASCEVITFDVFARFDKMWDYRNEVNRQLKKWLDPMNTGKRKADGFDPYANTSEGCSLITNFLPEDIAGTVFHSRADPGVYSGNNSVGITEICEKFKDFKSAFINGIALGVSDYRAITPYADLTVRIYTGDELPELAVKQIKFPLRSLTANAMNYLEFPEPVFVEGNFFIAVAIPVSDSLAIYQSFFRPLVSNNTFLVKQSDIWQPINQYLGDNSQTASLLIQANVCGISFSPPPIDTTQVPATVFKVYPNPASRYLIVEFPSRTEFDVQVYDMAGKLILSDCFQNRLYGELDVSWIKPGIYLIRVMGDDQTEVRRIAITSN
jgi:lysyl endopeptidase